jgi:hypothetical protein
VQLAPTTTYGALDPFTAAAFAPVQLAVARLILREFVLAGYPTAIALAAVVNAKAESNLNPLAVGDNGASIGLFQLYERGAGAGMTVEQRQDPATNTRRIIQEVRTYGGPMMQAYQAGASLADLAGLFARDIERPADRTGEQIRRAAMARSLFPGLADMPGYMLPPGVTLLPGLLPWWAYVVPGVVVGGVIVLGLALRG